MMKLWYKNSLVFDSYYLNKYFIYVICLEEKEGNLNNDKVV